MLIVLGTTMGIKNNNKNAFVTDFHTTCIQNPVIGTDGLFVL